MLRKMVQRFGPQKLHFRLIPIFVIQFPRISLGYYLTKPMQLSVIRHWKTGG